MGFRWPFTISKRDDEESFSPRATEIERRLKALEREFDDLHASYRKLRATQAREARGPDAPSGGNGDERIQLDQGLSKPQLRDKYLKKLRPQ